MSDTIINLSAYTNGLLTDLTSIAFQSEDGTYGLKRTDTGAVVLASGATFPRIAIGTYQKTFTDPAANLTYDYTIRIVTGGVTRYYNLISAAAPSINFVYAIPVTSTHYSSQAEVLRQLGVIAVDLMMEDWETSDASAVWSDILEEVDETIDIYITHKYPHSSFANPFLRRLGTKLACHLISGRRGNPSLYVREANLAMDKLERIRGGQLNVPNLIPIGNTGPVVRNYRMQPIPYPQRVEQFKSTGDSYARMQFAIDPYLLTY